MINFADGTWSQVASWADNRLAQEREKNDAADLDAVGTAVLRGRIALLKELLSLPRQAQARAWKDGPIDE